MTTFFQSLINLRHLRMHLAHEGLTARERFGYLMVWSVWITMASVTAVELTEPTKIVLYAIAIGGIWWVYLKNGGADGHALLDRYFCIGMIVTLRVTVVLFTMMGALQALQLIGMEVFAASAYLQYFLAQAEPADGGAPVGMDAVQELIMMAAELYVAWSIGRHIGKIREAAGDAQGLAPVASMTAAPPPAIPGAYGGWTGRAPATPVAPSPVAPPTSRPLDRFVERVVQSEMAEKSARRPAKSSTKTPARVKRKSSVRLINSRRTGR